MLQLVAGCHGCPFCQFCLGDERWACFHPSLGKRLLFVSKASEEPRKDMPKRCKLLTDGGEVTVVPARNRWCPDPDHPGVADLMLSPHHQLRVTRLNCGLAVDVWDSRREDLNGPVSSLHIDDGELMPKEDDE